MALIKCSECEKEISDKANSCPNCGNPINAILNNSEIKIAAFPDQSLKIEPELTSRKWKKVKIISWLVILSGWVSATFLYDPINDRQAIGWFIVVFGFITLAVAHIGAWYADKRTR